MPAIGGGHDHPARSDPGADRRARQLSGSNSAILLAGWVQTRPRTSRRQRNGSILVGIWKASKRGTISHSLHASGRRFGGLLMSIRGGELIVRLANARDFRDLATPILQLCRTGMRVNECI